MKRFMIFAAMVAMTATAAMAQSVDDIAERAYDLLVAKNYDAAFPLMLQAAEKGDCISMGNLGTMYYKGLGTAVNYNEALHWWGQAEKNGCGDAIKAYRNELMATKSLVCDGIRYLVNPDFTLIVVKYLSIGPVRIPERVVYNDKTYRVTSIGEFAFYNQMGESGFDITSVTIPNSVTTIGESAFANCGGLTSLTIPNSVTSIGNEAFRSCSGLTSVSIPNSVTSIGDGAFSGCSELTSVTIPNSVTTIGENAFSSCVGTVSVDGGNPKYDSRNNCNAIIESSTNTLILGCKRTIIPNSVTTIGESAFAYCEGLTSVTIPNSVTTIGESAFAYCEGLTSVTIPNSVTSIGKDAFCGCTGLTSVTIPNSVTSIGDGAFSGCSELTSVTIPKSVTKIGVNIFKNCSELESIEVEKGNTIYDSRNNCNAIIESETNTIIAGCNNTIPPKSVTSVRDVDLTGLKWYKNQPDGLVYVGVVAYEYKGKMPDNTSINLRKGTKSIADYAFRWCNGLTSVTIPNSVTSIGKDAFFGCRRLTSVTIPNSVTSIGEHAFYDCSGLKSVTIPNSVTSISRAAFAECSGLTSVTIPNSVTTIGESTFAYCGGLTSLTIPNSVTSIGKDAFCGCTGLTSVTIPNSVTSIGEGAFWGCTGLTSLTIPNSVTSIGEGAFNSCLETISVEGGNPKYDSRNNCNAIIESSSNTLIFGCKRTIIPISVTAIGDRAFAGRDWLTSLTIPNSVTVIGDSVFFYCRNLTSVTIPNSVTSIGKDAFYRCDGLTSVTIPNSITSIGKWAFVSCSALQNIYCKIEDISNVAVDEEAFSGVPASCVLRVPRGTADSYSIFPPWNKFKTIIEE